MTTNRAHGRRRLGASLLAAGLVFTAAGCDELLQVSNPNNVAGDDILNPAAASALANGALSGVARGYAQILTSYATATDELEWSGSRDAFQELDFGTVDNPFNEFLDAEYPSLAQGNWMAREAVRVLTQHQSDGTLLDSDDLARAHLYLAISYIIIGDMFDDWTYSDRATAAAPVGTANMVANTYDLALSSLTIAEGSSEADVVTAAMAFRARAEQARAIWSAARNQTGLVNAGASQAAAALAAMGDPDYKWGFTYSASTVTASIGGWVNDRQEMRISPAYATPDPAGNPTFDQVSLTDPIDASTVSPELESTILAFSAASDKPVLNLVSAREMHLIMAESELEQGNMTNFATHINNLRALDGLTAWDPAAPQVPAMDLLIHHRRTDLYLQGRRLADHYRFDDPSREWQSGTVASTNPGTFFPITVIECRANENIPDSCN